jgi:hypothetical protein
MILSDSRRQTWGDIRAAFKAWAKGFLNRLDEEHES